MPVRLTSVHATLVLPAALLLLVIAGLYRPLPEAGSPAVATATLTAPLYFEPNVGQMDGQARFLLRGQRYTLHLTAGGAVISLSGAATANHNDVVEMRLRGRPSVAADMEGEWLQDGQSHYFIGADPQGWHSAVPHYGRVRYRAVYPGIDLLFYGAEHRLEYDFLLAPGADPTRIAFDFSGAEAVTLNGQGQLLIKTGNGHIVQQPPRAYQRIDGVEHPVESAYVLDHGRVSFVLGAYDPNLPLVIDPVLSYAAYLGGSGNDKANAVAVDAAGNRYVTGQTNSADFPLAGSSVADQDVFVAKYSPAGQLIATAILGADNTGYGDRGNAVTVAADGGVYVAGYASRGGSSLFPVTGNAFQNCNLDLQGDAFVARLGSNLSTLDYASCFGGSKSDEAHGVAVDAQGRIWLAGLTYSADLLAVARSPSESTYGNAFIAQIDPTSPSSTVSFADYIDGALKDEALALVYSAGDDSIVVAGSTNSPGLPGCGGCGIDGIDVFVAKYAAANGVQQFAVVLGGSADDGFFAIDGGRLGLAVDAAGLITVAATTASANLPVTATATQRQLNGSADVMLAQLSGLPGAINRILYMSYFGGSGIDSVGGLAADAAGARIVLAGATGSTDLPGADNVGQFASGTDAFIARFNVLFEPAYVFTYGGSGMDSGTAIALHDSGAVTVVGTTDSGDLGNVVDPAPGGGDAFVVGVAPAFHDLALSGAGPGGVVASGQVVRDGLINYQVAIANNGPDTAENVVFSALLPAEVSLVAVPSGCTSTNAVLNCEYASLGRGEQLTVGFDVQVLVANGFTVEMRVAAGVGSEDLLPANNVLYVDASPAQPFVVRDGSGVSGGSGGGALAWPGLLLLYLAHALIVLGRRLDSVID